MQLGHVRYGPIADIALAAFHSITSSARESSEGGTVNPSALAVLRLMTNSNFVGCWTGRSEVFLSLGFFAVKCHLGDKHWEYLSRS